MKNSDLILQGVPERHGRFNVDPHTRSPWNWNGECVCAAPEAAEHEDYCFSRVRWRTWTTGDLPLFTPEIVEVLERGQIARVASQNFKYQFYVKYVQTPNGLCGDYAQPFDACCVLPPNHDCPHLPVTMELLYTIGSYPAILRMWRDPELQQHGGDEWYEVMQV